MLIKVISPVESGDEPREARYHEDGFVRWYDEVFREGYKRDNQPISAGEAAVELIGLGYEVVVEHSYLVSRPGKVGLDRAVIVVAETTMAITNDEDLVAEIRDVVTTCARQGKGDFRQIYEYAGTDMNIGDLAEYADQIALHSCSIYEMEFKEIDLPENWHYDTSLCGEIEEDAYESSS